MYIYMYIYMEHPRANFTFADALLTLSFIVPCRHRCQIISYS